MRREPAEAPGAEARRHDRSSEQAASSAREVHWPGWRPTISRRPLGEQAASGIGKVRCVVEKALKFPELRLDMSVQLLRGDRHRFDLTVAATGELKDRDAWQAAFELWCGRHSLHPVFVRGNIRTKRTQARVAVAGGSPVLDSFAQLAGIDSPFLSGGSEARISQLEMQVAMLLKQIAQLAPMIERFQSRVGIDGR